MSALARSRHWATWYFGDAAVRWRTRKTYLLTNVRIEVTRAAK